VLYSKRSEEGEKKGENRGGDFNPDDAGQRKELLRNKRGLGKGEEKGGRGRALLSLISRAEAGR